MTSSYFAARGRAADMPPDISSTNYLETEADMVKPVNQEIDRIQRGYDTYFDSLVQYYNHEFKKKTPGEQAVSTLADFHKIAPGLQANKKKIDQWLEFKKKYDKFYGLRFSDKAWNRVTNHVDENWDHQDADVLKYLQVLPLMNDTQRANYEEAKKALRNRDFSAARELFNGLADAFKDQIDDDATSLDLRKRHGTHYRPRAESGMRIWLGDENGFPGYNRFVVYNEVINDERARLYVDRTIDAYFAFRHEDLFRGRLGKFKHEFVKKLIERSDLRTKTAHEAQGSALQDNEKKSRAQDIKQRIKIDPGYLVTAINIYSGQFGGEEGEDFALHYGDPTRRSQMALTRADVFRTVGEAILADPDPELIQAYLTAREHKFQAHDGSWTTPRRLWQKDDAKVMKIINQVQNETINDAKETETAEDNAWVAEQVNAWDSRKTPGTAKERFNIVSQWMRKNNEVDPQKAPQALKDLAYSGEELDEDIDYRLTKRAARGEEITQADIRGISDPILLDKWKKLITENAGFSLDTDGHQLATTSIKAIIAKRLGEDIQKVQGNPLFSSNFEGGFQVYLGRYRELKKAQPGISDGAAHAGALEAARIAINTQVELPDGTKTGDYVFDRRVGGLDQKLKDDVQLGRKQLIENNNLLFSPTPWKGEEKHLEAAAIYIQTTGAGIAGVLPSYYRMVSKGLQGKYANPEILMRTRLSANGLLKGESDITIPEFDNLTEKEAVELTVNPSACKTYIQMQNMASKEEDINWMLEIVKDPTAMNEGGYDYVVSPNIDQGKDAHLPKPLTQHTVGEVLELARSGHTDFGAYGITSSGLISIIEANQVPLDIPFDQNTQDLFVLGRLRQKTQQAQNFTTQQDAYRRLVNINPKDNEEFLRIVGDLPPFLQLSNMIPICSTELVNQTLQR